MTVPVGWLSIRQTRSFTPRTGAQVSGDSQHGLLTCPRSLGYLAPLRLAGRFHRLKEGTVPETIIDGVGGLKALVGKELGRTRWREMTFEAIQRFANATGDHQWIHVDRERIAR